MLASGVRSSWLTVETSSSFSRSIALRSVMSRTCAVKTGWRPTSMRAIESSAAKREPSARSASTSMRASPSGGRPVSRQARKPVEVALAELRRDDQLGERPAERLVPRQAEGLLGGGVPLEDAPLVVGGDHAVERRLEHGLLARLAHLERLLGAAPVASTAPICPTERVEDRERRPVATPSARAREEHHADRALREPDRDADGVPAAARRRERARTTDRDRAARSARARSSRPGSTRGPGSPTPRRTCAGAPRRAPPLARRARSRRPRSGSGRTGRPPTRPRRTPSGARGTSTWSTARSAPRGCSSRRARARSRRAIAASSPPPCAR